MFERLSDLPGELSMRRSQAAATDDFLRANFDDGPYHDTVYVTANPRLDTVEGVKEQFHDVVDVWRTHWDEELETVPPDVMAERTLAAHEQYPNKRIVAHFIQPHGPFVGETGLSEIGVHSGIADHKRDALGEAEDEENSYVWELVRRGVVSPTVAKRAYDENLELALPHVRSLFEEASGRFVVTSDHGNMLGERAWPLPVRVWGHPNGILTDELVNVPWLTYQSGNRREVVAEEPVEANEAGVDEAVEDRLEQLGYT